MAIDFTIPEDAKEVRERVRRWVEKQADLLSDSPARPQG